MTSADETPTAGDEGEFLTRAEAAAFLSAMGVRMKTATLARLWSTASDGPPVRHIRSKPYYPQRLLGDWGRSQISDLRTCGPARRRRPGGDVVDEPSDQVKPAPGFASVLTDPAVSRAAKVVLLAWRDRDWLDAADDARLLAGVFEAEADRLIRRLSCRSG